MLFRTSRHADRSPLKACQVVSLACILNACGDNLKRSEEAPDAAVGADTVYTIGGESPDFADFASALAFLNGAPFPEGGIEFRVRPERFDERVTIGPIAGTSETSPLIFRAESGRPVLVGAGTDASDDVMMHIAGADFVTVEGIDIEAPLADDSNRVEFGILVAGTADDGSTDNLFVDMRIKLDNHRRTRAVVMRSQATPETGEAGMNHRNRFERLHIAAAGSGVQLIGGRNRQSLSPYYLFELADRGNQIIDCEIGVDGGIGHQEASGAFGISAANQRELVIRGNRVEQVSVTATPALPVGISGLSLDTVDGTVESNQIQGIRFTGSNGSGVSGIRATAHPAGEIIIANNFISGLSRADYLADDGDNSLYLRGIRLANCYDCPMLESFGSIAVLFNTIVVEIAEGQRLPGAAVALAGGTYGKMSARIVGNLLVSRGLSGESTARAYGLVDGNTDRAYLVSDFNNFLVSGPSGVLGQIGRELGGSMSEAADLSSWQDLSSGDAGSTTAAVSFVDESAGNLHLTESVAPTIPAIAEVADDIDGDLRPETTAIGADQP